MGAALAAPVLFGQASDGPVPGSIGKSNGPFHRLPASAPHALAHALPERLRYSLPAVVGARMYETAFDVAVMLGQDRHPDLRSSYLAATSGGSELTLPVTRF
jgi:hypothetical protein